jgi:hypothetical protein
MAAETERTISRVDFRCRSDLTSSERESILSNIVSGPFPPEQAEVVPEGQGWVSYLELTPTEREEVVQWLRTQQFIDDVV